MSRYWCLLDFRNLSRVSLVLSALALCSCATDVRHAPGDSDGSARVRHEVVMQNPALTPQNGGRLVDVSELETGDILLSAGKGITTYGVELFTTSPVSHAALYVGQSEIIEAVGQGVRRRSLKASLEEEAVVAAFRTPALQPEQAQRIVEFAEAQIGKKYNHMGVLLHAPFSLERRLCELPVIPTRVRDACLRGVASIQLGAVSDKSFFCSQFLIEAYRSAGAPITDADPRWISPGDIMHMREGDVASMPANLSLMYIGHLKFHAPFALTPPPAQEL